MTDYRKKNNSYSMRLNEYKQKVIQRLLSDNEITSTLDNTVDPSELLYNNIFPFGKIPGIIDVAKAYITVEVMMVESYEDVSAFRNIEIIITIICHDDIMKTDVGMTRIDYLSILIERLFNGDESIGYGRAEVFSNVEGAWSAKHSFRELKIMTKDLIQNFCDR